MSGLPVSLTIKGTFSPLVLSAIRGLVVAEQGELTEKYPSVSPAQQRLLRALAASHTGSLDSKELEAATGIKGSSVRPLMARLVALGYVERLPRLSGRTTFTLTERGTYQTKYQLDTRI